MNQRHAAPAGDEDNGPTGGGRQDNGAQPVRRPGTNVPRRHGGPICETNWPTIEKLDQLQQVREEGRPQSLTWPSGDLHQLPLSGNSLCGGVGAFEPRPVWEKTAGRWASCYVGGPTSPPKMEERTTFLRASMLPALQESSSEERDLSTRWVPKPAGSAPLIWGGGRSQQLQWVPSSPQCPSRACAQLRLRRVEAYSRTVRNGVPRSLTHLVPRLLG